MNIYVTTDISLTPVERAEMLVAGVFSNVKSLEDFMRSYPLVDFRDITKDLMELQDRVMTLAVKADKIKRNEDLDAVIDAGGISI